MRTLPFVMILISLLLLCCKADKKTVWSDEQLRRVWFPLKDVGARANSVSAQGHWKQIRGGLITRVPVLNAVSITCSKIDETCTEARADLYSPLDSHPVFKNEVRLDAVAPDRFHVQSWSSDGSILATFQTDNADYELRVSAVDKTVERTYRETKSRGVQDADPGVVYVWVLE